MRPLAGAASQLSGISRAKSTGTRRRLRSSSTRRIALTEEGRDYLERSRRLLADLAEFFNAFSGMVDGFQARAKRVNSLLGDSRTCFLVVCGPQGEPVDEAVLATVAEGFDAVGDLIAHHRQRYTKAGAVFGVADAQPTAHVLDDAVAHG